jgi:hypothetical protein
VKFPFSPLIGQTWRNISDAWFSISQMNSATKPKINALLEKISTCA